MRDVSAKTWSLRTATARAVLKVDQNTLVMIQEGRVPKGDPYPVAKVAAIQAVKKTPELIPYCHTVPIEHVDVLFKTTNEEIIVEVSVKSVYKTGVEMEAMAGAMVAVLNLYDVLKMIDDTMEVRSVTLVEKKGGKSQVRTRTGWRFGVIVVSDRVSRGESADVSGEVLKKGLAEHGGEEAAFLIVSDEPAEIQKAVEDLVALDLDLLVLTGGTGLGPRDNTPQVLDVMLDKDLPGVAGQFQVYGQQRTPFAMLSRSRAGLIEKTVVLALPGSSHAAEDALSALFPYLLHAFSIVRGGGHD